MTWAVKIKFNSNEEAARCFERIEGGVCETGDYIKIHGSVVFVRPRRPVYFVRNYIEEGFTADFDMVFEDN